MSFKIGNVEIKNRVVLAPMAGTSNPAYMKICEEMNAGYAITELISAEAIVRDNKKTLDMLKGYEKLNMPYAIQLFGSKSSVLARAAKYVEKNIKPDIIDINMGCPVPKVALSGAGSGLLKNPDNIADIVSQVVKSVNIPVTVKIRSGWDKNSINAVEIAKMCEQLGISAITLHGRTRTQGYSGNVDYEIIKKVKESVNIPVIGNGDIKTIDDALNMINYTGCDAIMIGRAALGNPWIIKRVVKYLEEGIVLPNPSNEEIIDMIKRHLNYLLEIKSEKIALLEMRTNCAYYLKGMSNAKKVKQEIFKTKTKEEFIKVIESVI